MSDLNSGPTRDPIQDLENFGTGGIAVNPLEPAAVRRLGDKRRRRQNSIYGAIAAVAVAAAVIPTAIIATKDGSSGPPISNTPTPKPTPTATPTRITFPGDGVQMQSVADIDELTGTSDEFKTFITGVLQKAIDNGASCPDAYHGVSVEKYDSEGFALGGVNDCGGYVALWTIQDGQWKEALGTQDEWRCGDLTRFSVPDGFAGDCYGPKALFGPTEDAGLRLGMSAEEVQAAGGTVSGPGNGCSYVFPKGLAMPPGGTTLGYLSATPGKGVVALYIGKDQITDQGISRFDSKDAVEKAYPQGHLQQPQGAWYSPIDDSSYYRFDFNSDGQVEQISIVSNDQDCYE